MDRKVPNSSSFCFRGVSSSCASAIASLRQGAVGRQTGAGSKAAGTGRLGVSKKRQAHRAATERCEAGCAHPTAALCTTLAHVHAALVPKSQKKQAAALRMQPIVRGLGAQRGEQTTGGASSAGHLILPMAVAAPVPTTTPRARPAVTTVPLNSMLVLSCTTALAASTGEGSLATEPDSPVRMDCSHRGREVEGGREEKRLRMRAMRHWG